MEKRHHTFWTVLALASLPMAGCGPALQLTLEMMRHPSSHAQVEPAPERPAATSAWTLAAARQPKPPVTAKAK